ncbi:DUF1302 family protein [Ralstonia sp.]|uniref:DUF1302 family protein n=1 Tax=Ralstonia sp. TaxID=54061 RepID=UPI0031CDD51D
MTMHHEVPLPKVGLSRFTSTKPVAAVHAADVSPPEEASDTRVTWNNTARYSAVFLTRSQNPALLRNVNADDGDRNFNRGLLSNRVDLPNELDVVTSSGLGFRLSALGRYDSVYNERNDAPGFVVGAVPNKQSVAPDRFTVTAKRLDRCGRSAPKPLSASTRGRSASPWREHDLTALSQLVEQSRDRLPSAQGLAHDRVRTDMPLRGHFNTLDAFPRVDL